jgi:hypothetical protein
LGVNPPLNKPWYPVLVAAAVLGALALAALPLFIIQAQRAARAERLAAEAARRQAEAEEVKALRANLDRLTAATDRRLAKSGTLFEQTHPELEEVTRASELLSNVHAQTQGWLALLRSRHPDSPLIPDAEALAARQRKELGRLNKLARKMATTKKEPGRDSVIKCFPGVAPQIVVGKQVPAPNGCRGRPEFWRCRR